MRAPSGGAGSGSADLREDPEEAPYSEEDFGRYSTVELNGKDRDHTRRRGRSTDVPSLVDSPDIDGPIGLPRRLRGDGRFPSG